MQNLLEDIKTFELSTHSIEETHEALKQFRSRLEEILEHNNLVKKEIRQHLDKL